MQRCRSDYKNCKLEFKFIEHPESDDTTFADEIVPVGKVDKIGCNQTDKVWCLQGVEGIIISLVSYQKNESKSMGVQFYSMYWKNSTDINCI